MFLSLHHITYCVEWRLPIVSSSSISSTLPLSNWPAYGRNVGNLVFFPLIAVFCVLCRVVPIKQLFMYAVKPFHLTTLVTWLTHAISLYVGDMKYKLIHIAFQSVHQVCIWHKHYLLVVASIDIDRYHLVLYLYESSPRFIGHLLPPNL